MGLLDSKRALVTGGTTGLGLAIAGRFRREGAQVVITGQDRHHAAGRRRDDSRLPAAGTKYPVTAWSTPATALARS